MRSVSGARRWPARVSGVSVAVVYVAFSMMDLLLSQAAFMLGVAEGNPFMAWLANLGLFTAGKVGLTILTAAIIAAAYQHRQVQSVAWAALALTGAVNAYHLWGLSLL